MDGGGNTLRSSLIGAVESNSMRHEFIVFRTEESHGNGVAAPSVLSRARQRISSNPVLGPVARGIRQSLRTLSPESEPASAEEQHIRIAGIDIAWFMWPVAQPVSIPYFATVWDLEHRKQPYFPEVSTTGWTWDAREQNFRTLLPRAARVLTGTETGKREVIAFYGVNPVNVRVIPHPAADAYRQRTNESCGVRQKYGLANPFIFYPAQFWPHKNHVNLLLALQRVNEGAAQPLDLVLSGSDKGNLSHVRHMIGELDLAERVHILGFLPAAEIVELYREAVALVYATLFGPDNLPPLEAFASGCPVAASDIDGAAEQFGEAAIRFNPLDADSIAGAIRSIRRDEVRSVLVQRGHALAAQRTPQHYVEQVCDVIDEFEPFRRCWGRSYVHT